MSQRIALLWATPSLGLYSNADFNTLYRGVGHNNGNLAFVYAIAAQLEGEIEYLPWHSKPSELNKYDVIVVPCANQFGAHTDLAALAEIFKQVNRPIVAIGLGAQAENVTVDVEVKEGTLEWVRQLDAHRPTQNPNIYTRGPYTSAQLERFSIGSIVGGCPSHFIAHNPRLGKQISDNWRAVALPRAISVAGGHQSWMKVRAVEQQLISMMMDPGCFGQYVVQSMGDMIKISRGLFDEIDAETFERIRLHTVPHYTIEEFKNWCRNYVRSFYDVPTWMDSLRNHDLTIGPRYHGAQLALQAGKMAIVVTIDSRTEELCSQTGVPFVSHATLRDRPLTRSELKKLVPFDGNKYDRFRRERAQNYVAFLTANGLTPKPYLTRIAAAPAEKSPDPAPIAPATVTG